MSGRAGRDGSAPLVERDRELAALEEALDAARERRGRLVVLEGAAGIGKSRLLGIARERAQAAGVRILDALGSELEREFPFGVTLQLLETPITRLCARERRRLLAGAASLAAPLFESAGRAAGAPADRRDFSLLHGLYWLVANLAERVPLLLAVDDLHGADVSSLRFLHYLVHRVGDLPIALVVATRPGDAGEARELMLALAAHPGARVLKLAPLSASGAAGLVREAFPAPDSSFTDCCIELTRGNPFLLRELLRSLVEQGAAPDQATAQRMAAYEVAPRSIIYAAALRLARLPAAAMAFARAVVILGDDALASRVRRLAGLDATAAGAAIAALDDAEIIDAAEPLTFVHPLVAAAVAAEIPAGDRAVGHRRAAELLRAEGVDEQRLAAHLLRSPCADDAFTVGVLRAVAARAIARGAPESAVVYLRRALAEPPAQALRAELLIELGEAHGAAGGEQAVERFEAGLQLLEDPGRRAESTGNWAASSTRRADTTRPGSSSSARARRSSKPIPCSRGVRLRGADDRAGDAIGTRMADR